jgi:hypothetical protein
MNSEHEHDDGVEELLRSTMKTDLPPEVRGRMRNQLAVFRDRLDTRARAGRARVLRVASVSVAAMVAAVVGTLVIFLGQSAKPTWADVRERFDSVPFFNATIYVKENALAQPVQIDLWMGQKGRLRLQAGNRVTFGEKGRALETVSFAPTPKVSTGLKQAQHMVEEITRAIGNQEVFSLDVLVRALRLGGTLSPPLENQNVGISDDLVVFDITNENSPEWVRIWALRESRLPVRVLF